MAAETQTLICSACGARNRPSWEFCARCGESLQGLTLRVAAEEFEPEPEELDAAPTAPSPLPGWFVLTVGAVLLGANVVACLRSVADAPPPASPDPGVFAAVGNQTVAPRPASTPPGPGAKSFEEGYRLLSQKRPADAIPLLTEAAAAAPDKPEYQRALAEAYWASGDRSQSLTYYQRAATLDPRRYGIDYATALDGAGRKEEAVREYQSQLAKDGENAQLQEKLGRLYARGGDFVSAAPLLEKAAAASPTDPELLQELAYSLEKANESAQALDVYRKVVALAPDAAVSRSRLAEGLYAQGKADEALNVLKEGISRSPQPLLERQLGSVLERSGNLAEAAKAYRDYSQLAPNAADAKDLVARADTLDAIVAQRQQQ